MFRGVKSRFPRLLPILREDYVAARIVRAVQGDQRQLILPPLVRLLPLMRILPVSAFDWIAGALGVNASMDEFEGRGPR
jgi:all-trans-retinol dehydrogenase (NAD+)